MAILLYSAFAKDFATSDCFLDHHEIKLGPKRYKHQKQTCDNHHLRPNPHNKMNRNIVGILR